MPSYEIDCDNKYQNIAINILELATNPSKAGSLNLITELWIRIFCYIEYINLRKLFDF